MNGLEVAKIQKLHLNGRLTVNLFESLRTCAVSDTYELKNLLISDLRIVARSLFNAKGYKILLGNNFNFPSSFCKFDAFPVEVATVVFSSRRQVWTVEHPCSIGIRELRNCQLHLAVIDDFGEAPSASEFCCALSFELARHKSPLVEIRPQYLPPAPPPQPPSSPSNEADSGIGDPSDSPAD